MSILKKNYATLNIAYVLEYVNVRKPSKNAQAL